jgi:Kef-type K+ transport system membrane component KefB
VVRSWFVRGSWFYDAQVSLKLTASVLFFALHTVKHARRYEVTSIFTTNRQLLVLTMVAFCLASSTLSAYFGLSMEMGAFVGGLLVSLVNRASSFTTPLTNSSATSNSFVTPLEQLESGTPSKPSSYHANHAIHLTAPTTPPLNGSFTSFSTSSLSSFSSSSSAAVVASVVGPLRNFFSFLYYATIGMALNPFFMFHNFHIILGMTVAIGIIKTIVFAFALGVTGAPMLTAVT